MIDRMTGAGGFWSYVHDDDAAEGARISHLAELIKTEYGLLTGGEDIEIFVDRSNLRWGDEWRRRINTSLEEITFFIPVITPRYLRSAECRKELLVFAGHATSLGVRELLLPILYIDVPNLDEDSNDEAVALIAGTQYEPWTALRLEPETSAEYRRAVNKLALRLRDIAVEVDSRPVDVAIPITDPLGDVEDLGLLDSAVLGEELAPLWGDALEKLTEIIGRMKPVVEGSSAAMDHAQTAGAKLIVAKKFADDIDGLASEFLEAADEYAGRVLDLDPVMLRIIRAALDTAEDGGDVAEYADLFGTVLEAVEEVVTMSESTTEFRLGLRSLARLTKSLKQPLGKLAAGAVKIEDVRGVFEEWRRQIEASGMS